VLHDVQTAERGHRFGLSFYRGLMPIWGNVLLLLPLGFFLPWLSARWRRWKAIALVLLLTAVGFELIQLAGTLAYGFPYMRIDVDTIWLSFIGGMIGFGLFKVMTPHLQLLGMKNEDAVE
jgi:glycopeptide antibiotics resistance protein